MSGIDEQAKLCDCFDREDASVYWTIGRSSETLGYMSNKSYIAYRNDKVLTVYNEFFNDGITSFISMIRHFKCSKCQNIHKQGSPEFDKLIRLVRMCYEVDGWGIERNT